jgi:hypothetical protein
MMEVLRSRYCPPLGLRKPPRASNGRPILASRFRSGVFVASPAEQAHDDRARPSVAGCYCVPSGRAHGLLIRNSAGRPLARQSSHRWLVLGTLAILALQRHVKTLDQAVVAKWLGEEAARTCLQDTRTTPLLGKSGDEDDGHAVTGRV